MFDVDEGEGALPPHSGFAFGLWEGVRGKCERFWTLPLKALRSLIVGGADRYLKYDDDFQRSKSELGRIRGRLREGPAQGLAVFADRLPTVLNEIENGDGPAMARNDALAAARHHLHSPLTHLLTTVGSLRVEGKRSELSDRNIRYSS